MVFTVPGWLSTRHSLRVEAAVVLALYALYEASRGFVHADHRLASRHAHDIVAAERWLHVFVEHWVQRASGAVPGLVGTFGFLDLTLYLTATVGCLLWLHRRHPEQFPFVRTWLAREITSCSTPPPGPRPPRWQPVRRHCSSAGKET